MRFSHMSLQLTVARRESTRTQVAHPSYACAVGCRRVSSPDSRTLISSIAHIADSQWACRCPPIDPHFTAHLSRSTPSLLLGFHPPSSSTLSQLARDYPISSALTGLAPARLGFPAFAAFTQPRNVCSFIPSAFSADANPRPALMRLTANCSNSTTCSCFGILKTLLPTGELSLYLPLGRRNFGGTLKRRANAVVDTALPKDDVVFYNQLNLLNFQSGSGGCPHTSIG